MQVILIPGLWLDGSSWDAVVPVLQQAGHRTHALTLPGMGSLDEDRSQITLRDHVDAVVGLIDQLVSSAPDDSKVILVGHSGGGAIAHAAADARPDRIARVVYVDSWPMADGDVINDGFPNENGEIPLPDWSLFDAEDLVDMDDQLRDAFRRRAIPSPLHVATDHQQLSDERRFDIPITVIACEFTSETLRGWMNDGAAPLRELRRINDVTYVDLPTGHWPQFSRPEGLADSILASIDSA